MASSDPYTAKASKNATLAEKSKEISTIIKAVKTAMLTTVAPQGALHSRAMVPADTSGLTLSFLANNHSGKFSDLSSNPQVNVSFYDPSTTNWLSLAGNATIVDDKEEIKKLWTPAVKAWFGDLGDGIHTGDANDPRIAAIRVEPEEVNYWFAQSKVVQVYEVAKGALTGETAAPGSLRTLSKVELEQLQAQDAI